MPNDVHFDIVIAGGGMIGSCLALALAPLGKQLAIIEPIVRSAAAQPSFDDRSTALSRSSQRMFEAMGLWDDIRAAATPITHIHVSDQGRFGFSHIDAEEQGVEALGYVVINRVLGEILQRELVRLSSLEFFCPASIEAAQLGPDRVRVETDDARAFSGDLLVAADGANSSVRTLLGIGASRKDYGQRAIVGNARTEKPLQGRAYERFTAGGPLAVLPLSEGRAGFVWNVPESESERILGLSDEHFVEELQQAFGWRLGRFSRIGRRASYRIALSKALRLTAQRSVLVGNAAHGLHPAAAQGFNLGLRDVATLCDCIAEVPNDAGAAAVLTRYAEWRRNDQRKLVGFTDGLVQLFGARSTPLRVVRDLGMLGFDLIPGVRKMFAKHTMGLAGRLPRLSRGVPLS